MTAERAPRSLPMRQALLFLVTIVLPCTVIAAMAARMLVQDRELVATRLAEERRATIAAARQALLSHAERLRRASDTGNPPAEVAFTAPLKQGEMVLPWESQHLAVAAGPIPKTRFGEGLARGERREFGENNFAAAAEVYRELARTTANPSQRAWARLLAARALTKSSRLDAARTEARSVLDEPATLADDQGIPYVVYAARVLAQSPIDAGEMPKIVTTLRASLASPALSPAAVYMMRDVIDTLQPDRGIANAITTRTQDIEQALSLRSALPTLGIRIDSVAEPSWVVFGPSDNVWLVSISANGPRQMLTAVRAAPLIAAVQADLPVTITATGNGDPLAPSFPGLRAVVSPTALAAVAAESSRQQPLYLGAIAMVVSIAVFGGVLFWRDVRREIRVAELRSQFVSSVSHELKTPLTAIRMFAETLMMGRARPEVQHEYLETIVNESERLTRLLNNVLDFSSIESGKKTYHLQPQSLSTIVHAAAKAMEYPLAQQGFELRLAIEEDLPAAAVDADAVQQAILNLLSNAIKYSGDGRIVDLELKRLDDTVVIAVTDRGFGIAPSDQTRIFEKYYRVRDGATARVPGTGLGLTLVEHVAHGHGGQVTVRSAPGAGSTFTLAIPIAPAAGAIAASEVPA